jgi:hypothetical protein
MTRWEKPDPKVCIAHTRNPIPAKPRTIKPVRPSGESAWPDQPLKLIISAAKTLTMIPRSSQRNVRETGTPEGTACLAKRHNMIHSLKPQSPINKRKALPSVKVHKREG